MTPDETTLRSEAIRQYCRQLRVPTVGSQFGRLAEEAVGSSMGRSGIWKRCWRPRLRNENAMPFCAGCSKRSCQG